MVVLIIISTVRPQNDIDNSQINARLNLILICARCSLGGIVKVEHMWGMIGIWRNFEEKRDLVDTSTRIAESVGVEKKGGNHIGESAEEIHQNVMWGEVL